MTRWWIILGVVFLFSIGAQSIPILDEERRNLCEGEPDLAACLKEIEEAKATPMTDMTESGQEEKGQEEETESDNYYDKLQEHHDMIKKVMKESDENTAYWEEELRSMNKWEKYGLG